MNILNGIKGAEVDDILEIWLLFSNNSNSSVSTEWQYRCKVPTVYFKVIK